MTNPNSILKSRDITLPTNVHKVKPMVFPVIMQNYSEEIAKTKCWMKIWKALFSRTVITNVLMICHRKLEKAMAPHSRTLAWEIPWTEEPGRLQSMGSLKVRQDWATSLSLFTFMPWRRKWQPTSVFLPGESQGRGSLVGCHLWGRTESDTTEAT